MFEFYTRSPRQKRLHAGCPFAAAPGCCTARVTMAGALRSAIENGPAGRAVF